MEPTWMNEKQLAAYWGISCKTLQRWRAVGDGPKYVKVGKSIRYRRSDAAEFETNAAITETRLHKHRSLKLPIVQDEADLSPAHKTILLRIRQFLNTAIRF